MTATWTTRRPPATITDGVQRALGREPEDFVDFARSGANDGTWEAAQ